nr:MAG TPA: hypothetical protein [Caudoviricetes sp.]DAS97245.1 MAG TPA: hypothetical protein [Caudoviricetes sp.]
MPVKIREICPCDTPLFFARAFWLKPRSEASSSTTSAIFCARSSDWLMQKVCQLVCKEAIELDKLYQVA